jgi:hypothetical protein
MNVDVENVVLYVDDAVRYDVLTDHLPLQGPTYKTVASSTHTPTSFGSLLTGLLPPNSGILSFKHSVPDDVRSVFDFEDHRVTMAAEGGMNHTIAEIFGNPPRATIEEVEPPFVHVVRRPGGHAPYDGFEWDSYEYRDETAMEYLWEIADDPERGREEYVDGVRRSFDEFQRVRDVLASRGLEDDTLVVYTSDHGELLGEYGFFGHTHLATPEVVYVPTTFVHPSLEPELNAGLFHHTDLLPTVGEALGVDVGRTDGTVLGRGRTTGYTHFEHVRYGKLPERVESVVSRVGGLERELRGLWDRDGGHVFVDDSPIANNGIFLYLLLQMPTGRQLLHNRQIREAHRLFNRRHQVYGEPSFDESEARAEIEALLGGASEPQVPAETGDAEETRDLDDETRDHLQDMGYI